MNWPSPRSAEPSSAMSTQRLTSEMREHKVIRSLWKGSREDTGAKLARIYWYRVLINYRVEVHGKSRQVAESGTFA